MDIQYMSLEGNQKLMELQKRLGIYDNNSNPCLHIFIYKIRYQ